MATNYQTEGKQAFRELFFAIAKRDGLTTFGTFWGTGIDSRMGAAAGFDVVACELVQAKHDAMVADAAEHGYRAHLGRAGGLRERLDTFHADFDGGPSPSNFREVRRIAAITDKWIAVTLSMDHLRDESMQGEAACYTIPAWLTGASGFTLQYLSRYKRNRFGQTMWVAILQRREGTGNTHFVMPIQIAYAVRLRGYWASRVMYETQLMPHAGPPVGLREKASSRSRRHDLLRAYRVECSECGAAFVLNRIMTPGRRPKFCSDDCRAVGRKRATDRYYKENRDKVIASARAWRQARLKPTRRKCLQCNQQWLRPSGKGHSRKYCGPECARRARLAQTREARLRDRLAAVSGTATEAIYDARVANQEKAA